MSTQSSRISDNGNKISKIIDFSSTNAQVSVKEKVKQKLAQDAQFLLDKKRRDQEKKLKVKIMEEQFERNRSLKAKVLTQKEVKSVEVRDKNKEQLNKKFKLRSEQFQKIVQKIEHNNEEEIQKALNLQKIRQNSPRGKSFSKTSKDNFSDTGRSSSRIPADNIEQKMESIMGRAEKAKRKHEQINKMMVQRIRDKTKSIQETQKRALSHSLLQQSQNLRQCYEKNSQLHRVAQNSKNKNQQRLTQKRKSVKQKLDRCSENLKHLNYLQQQRFLELETKFNKKSEPKQWRDPRLQKYKIKWQQNCIKIQQQKVQKAQQILSKHEQITFQNKIYKEQKDKLIQAVKYS